MLHDSLDEPRRNNNDNRRRKTISHAAVPPPSSSPFLSRSPCTYFPLSFFALSKACEAAIRIKTTKNIVR